MVQGLLHVDKTTRCDPTICDDPARRPGFVERRRRTAASQAVSIRVSMLRQAGPGGLPRQLARAARSIRSSSRGVSAGRGLIKIGSRWIPGCVPWHSSRSSCGGWAWRHRQARFTIRLPRGPRGLSRPVRHPGPAGRVRHRSPSRRRHQARRPRLSPWRVRHRSVRSGHRDRPTSPHRTVRSARRACPFHAV